MHEQTSAIMQKATSILRREVNPPSEREQRKIYMLVAEQIAADRRYELAVARRWEELEKLA